MATDLATTRAAARALQGWNYYSDDELLEAVRTSARIHGRCTTETYRADYMAGLVDPSPRVFPMRFGSWREALRLAGCGTRVRRGPTAVFTPERCLDAVRIVADDLGRLPSLNEYRAYRTQWPDQKLPCDALVRERLGGWLGALESLDRENHA